MSIFVFYFNTISVLQTNLNTIAEYAEEREEENIHFRSWLKQKDSKQLDRLVHEINNEVSAAIDCTQCGNCCKSLVINVEKEDAIACAKGLNLPTEEFVKKYIETSEEGNYFISAIPCHFFADKKCTIYEHRFTSCREFPYLHKEGFQSRLLSTLMHYGTCPIVYNVLEELKVRVGYLK